ncbi:MAG: MBL fold metallo-hydrolase [Anaerolineales bacterium]|nr:MBL fold metallo-hydrolase [Anaerolineales bacterium]
MPQGYSFQQFETSKGARVFRLPLQAFPDFWVYAYLVQWEAALVLIDAGSGSDRSNADLEAGFDQASRSAGVPFRIPDLTHILVTHGHIDHFGGINWLRSKTGAQIGVHELDYQTLAHHEERLALGCRRLELFLETAGVPAVRRTQLLEMYRFTRLLYRSVPVDFTYEAVGMHLGDFEMLHLPGHCPGAVAIRLHDLVFGGDHLLEKVVPHQSPEELAPFTGLHHYLAALSEFTSWAAGSRLVLAGHDAPIKDPAARSAAVREHLSMRLRQVLDLLAEPGTIFELTQKIYGELEGYNALLVIEKTGAYVEYLYLNGWLGIENAGDLERSRRAGGIRCRRLRDVSVLELNPKERGYVFV